MSLLCNFGDNDYQNSVLSEDECGLHVTQGRSREPINLSLADSSFGYYETIDGNGIRPQSPVYDLLTVVRGGTNREASPTFSEADTVDNENEYVEPSPQYRKSNFISFEKFAKEAENNNLNRAG